VKGHPRFPQSGDSFAECGGRGCDDPVAITGVGSAVEVIGPPQSHQVGRVVVVGRANHRVSDLPLGVQRAAHRDHIVVEQADRVQSGDAQAVVPVVKHTGDRPEIVMQTGRGPMLAESGQPDRAGGVGEIRIDLYPAKSNPERAGILPGGIIAYLDGQAITRVAVSKGKPAPGKRRRSEPRRPDSGPAENPAPAPWPLRSSFHILLSKGSGG
jgi:hypothetical protein